MPRSVAFEVLNYTLYKRQPFDQIYDQHTSVQKLESRDQKFAYNLIITTLRYLGQIDYIIGKCLTNKLPYKARYAQTIMRLGICQILFLNVPSHAAVNTSVDLAKKHGQSAYKKLINAILRRVSRESTSVLINLDSAKLNTPVWMWDSWVNAYGQKTTRKIAESHLKIPSIDLTAKSNPKFWAQELNGHLLPTGSIRLNLSGDPTKLIGFKEGAWWVQDAGASIPVQLFGDNIAGQKIADLCSAPGGKTAQLIAAGAEVIAIDRNKNRIEKMKQNLKRLGFSPSIICRDALTWRPKELLDGVLVDAPCTATGTIRRHPDIKYLKTLDDVIDAQKIQLKFLKAASQMVKPKGQIVYSTCSLQPEEGQNVINLFLSQNPRWRRKRLKTSFLKILQQFVTSSGDIRTFPFQINIENNINNNQKDRYPSGVDGFFSTCLIRR